MSDLHKTQREILVKLLFSEGLRYTDIKSDDEMENSQFNFHLQSLIKKGYVEQNNNKYTLTFIGKEYANRYDSDTKLYKKQAKVSVWLAVRRRVENSNEFEYLIGKRLKNPFYGIQGFITGKLEYGESVYEGAKRELMEEAGLKGEPKLIHIQHYTNKDEATDLVIEDKFFFLCLIDNPVGEVVQNNEVELEWIVEADFKNKIRKTADSIDEFLRIIKLTKKSDGNITFSEKQMYPKNF